MRYDYNRLTADADALSKKHKNIELFSIGESVMEKKLFCIKIGKGEKKLFLSGAERGLEYPGSAFIIKFFDEYAECAENGNDFFGYDVAGMLERTALYSVPMINPDEADIAVNGIDITNPHHRRLISNVGIHSFNKIRSADFSSTYARPQMLAFRPGEIRSGGFYAEHAPETDAINAFVEKTNFDMLVSLHCVSQKMYYDFDGCSKFIIEPGCAASHAEKAPDSLFSTNAPLLLSIINQA